MSIAPPLMPTQSDGYEKAEKTARGKIPSAANMAEFLPPQRPIRRPVIRATVGSRRKVVN
jgi:hypothetical protein